MHQNIFVQLIFVVCLAIACWWLAERFAPDGLLRKLVQLAIFAGVLIWVVTRLIPAVL